MGIQRKIKMFPRYRPPRADANEELAGTGMVEVYNNQYLWDNRQTQKVYDPFVISGEQKSYELQLTGKFKFLSGRALSIKIHSLGL